MLEDINTHKVLTTNWVLQRLYKVGESALGAAAAAQAGLFTGIIELPPLLGTESGIAQLVPGLEIGLGVLTLMRGLCQLKNIYDWAKADYDWDDEDLMSALWYLAKPLTDWTKGSVLVSYGCKALVGYRADLLTFSQAIPLAMQGFLIAAAISAVGACCELVFRIIYLYYTKKAHPNQPGEMREEHIKEAIREALQHFLLQAIKLIGTILLFNSNPVGWVFLAVAGASQLAVLGRDACDKSIPFRLGFFQSARVPSNDSSEEANDHRTECHHLVLRGSMA